MSWWLQSFEKYADFNGRSRRTEFWMFFLFTCIAGFLLGLLSEIGEPWDLLAVGLLIGCMIPFLSVSARRLHDTSHSGWLLLIYPIPLVNIYLLGLFVEDSDPGENEYGPNPKTVDTVPPETAGSETTQIGARAMPVEDDSIEPLEKFDGSTLSNSTTLREQAEQGNAQAQFDLAEMCCKGEEVLQDYAEALIWFKRAAGSGVQGKEVVAKAQFNLGVMNYEGQGLKPDYVEAHKWFNLAATKLTGEESKKAVAGRDRSAKKMNHTQVAEAQRLAVEWKPIPYPKDSGRASVEDVPVDSTGLLVVIVVIVFIIFCLLVDHLLFKKF